MIIIVEGLDRCGKDTQIRNIKQYLLEQNENKSVHELHYSSIPVKDNVQERSLVLYFDMFRIIDAIRESNDIHLILNRSHIGEAVYAPLYREYSGDYIFEVERHFKEALKEIKLITLIDSSFKCLDRDDGLSLSNKSLEKVNDELNYFIEATNKSHIKNKIIIDINGLSIDDVKNKIIEFVSK